MDWDKLRVFHSAARKGSFTHAGEELGISQSAVSRQVHALEQQVGVALFHRHARGLLLTEQGEKLFRTTSGIARELQAVEGALVDSRDRPRGVLRVTTTMGLGTTWLSSRIADFVETYPEVQLLMIFDDNELDIGMREADIAIRWRQPTQPDLVQRRLFTVHFHVYASNGYIAKYGAPGTLDELDGHRLVTFGPNPPGYLRELNWLEIAGRSADDPRPANVRISNMPAMKNAIAAGAGIGVLPDFIVERDADDLVRLDLGAEAPTYDLYFVYAEELRSSARVQAFRDFIVEKAEGWRF
ncbi:LysR family transcriptional regulator [Acuticoccus sediminis]|uniref:LysR family transcriptional regulator n=1 Tax=Acuticoccus sediminis TaxID=2184697 RepID=A0A8B2NQ30_9HYPH|nr:LysR family transcriptional regulator [Acuticoccus sediminis]RAH96991.1 LysR family transcriptional regulator [Acuticoccus sediminis]